MAAAVILLSGCTLFSSADGLLAPPKLSDEQTLVYKALLDDVGSGINLAFPGNGGERSAYIFADLDGDGLDEAAVFYRRASDGESVVRLNILDKSEGKWRSVYDCAGGGISIDKVSASPIGSSGKIFIAVGYNLITSGDKVLEVYSYNDGILQSAYSDSYFDYFVSDFNSDGSSEIITVNANTENHTAYSAMVSAENNSVNEVSVIDLSPKSIGIENITLGKAAENTPALFIDETDDDGSLFTEIVYSIGGNLRNPATVQGSEITDKTRRQLGCFSMDADGDGITEIPVNEVCAGYENETEKLYLTKWCVLENYDISRKYIGWYSRSQGWRMMFPGRWEGLITMKTDNITGAAVFCSYDGSLASSTELMRINAVTHEDSPALIEEGWQLIEKGENADYLVKLSDDKDQPLVLTFTEVKNNFYFD